MRLFLIVTYLIKILFLGQHTSMTEIILFILVYGELITFFGLILITNILGRIYFLVLLLCCEWWNYLVFLLINIIHYRRNGLEIGNILILRYLWTSSAAYFTAILLGHQDFLGDLDDFFYLSDLLARSTTTPLFIVGLSCDVSQNEGFIWQLGQIFGSLNFFGLNIGWNRNDGQLCGGATSSFALKRNWAAWCPNIWVLWLACHCDF